MSVASQQPTRADPSELGELYPGRLAQLLTPLCRPASVHRHKGAPCEHPGKVPMTADWTRTAKARWESGAGRESHVAATEQHLRHGGNVGMVVPPGVVVLDADTLEAMAWLDTALPDVPMQETSRGAHFMVRVPSGVVIDATTAAEIVEGIKVDLRVGGRSQIVVEPSVHATGAAYVWKRPLPANLDDVPMCPPLILEAITKKPQTEKSTKADGDKIPKGSRSNTLYRIARGMHAKGDSGEEIRARLQVRNRQRCDPPLDDSEVDAIAASATARPDDEDFGTESRERRATLVTFDSIEERRVEWLWPGRIPRGKITILDGDPDNMKTTLALDLCARVTTGKSMPMEPATTACGPAGAVFVSFEDDAADTLLPRFRLAGGNPALMALLNMADDDGPRSIEIPGDVIEIERALRGFNADLLVIDPLVAAFDGEVKTHSDHNVRRALAPLKALAERTGAAVLCIRHLNKSTGGKAIYRGGGSIGLIGAARAGFVVGPDPDDPDRRLFAPVKNNLAARPSTLAYRPKIVLRDRSDPDSGVATIEWLGVADVTAEEITNAEPEARGAIGDAMSVIEEMLQAGPVAAAEAEQQVRGAGIAPRTRDRAKKKLGVRSRRVVPEQGSPYWTWELPT